MFLHVFVNGRVGGASPFLFEGILGYLKIMGLAFHVENPQAHFFPTLQSPMKHCSTPSSFTPERNRNNQPRLNIIMNPPKPSKTTYLPSTHRLLLTLRHCEKQQGNWRASKLLRGFHTNKCITNIHFISISLSVFLVESSFSPSCLPFHIVTLTLLQSYTVALYGPQDPAVRQDTALLLVPCCCISCPQREAVAKSVTGKWTAVKRIHHLRDQREKWIQNANYPFSRWLAAMWIFIGKSFCKSWEPADVPPRLPHQIVAGDGRSRWFKFGPVDSLNITHPLIATDQGLYS